MHIILGTIDALAARETYYSDDMQITYETRLYSDNNNDNNDTNIAFNNDYIVPKRSERSDHTSLSTYIIHRTDHVLQRPLPRRASIRRPSHTGGRDGVPDLMRSEYSNHSIDGSLEGEGYLDESYHGSYGNESFDEQMHARIANNSALMKGNNNDNKNNRNRKESFHKLLSMTNHSKTTDNTYNNYNVNNDDKSTHSTNNNNNTNNNSDTNANHTFPRNSSNTSLINVLSSIQCPTESSRILLDRQISALSFPRDVISISFSDRSISFSPTVGTSERVYTRGGVSNDLPIVTEGIQATLNRMNSNTQIITRSGSSFHVPVGGSVPITTAASSPFAFQDHHRHLKRSTSSSSSFDRLGPPLALIPPSHSNSPPLPAPSPSSSLPSAAPSTPVIASASAVGGGGGGGDGSEPSVRILSRAGSLSEINIRPSLHSQGGSSSDLKHRGSSENIQITSQPRYTIHTPVNSNNEPFNTVVTNPSTSPREGAGNPPKFNMKYDDIDDRVVDMKCRLLLMLKVRAYTLVYTIVCRHVSLMRFTCTILIS